MEGQVLPLSDIFASVKHLIDGHICEVEKEEDGVSVEEGLVYKRMEGQELTNWTAMEIPEVVMLEK